MNNRVTINDLVDAKSRQLKITAVSCYDYTTAALVADADVDMILVGDSAAQVLLGFANTLPVKMDFMVEITAAVRRGAPNVFLVADMPFLSYQTSKADAVKNAGRFLTDCSAQMVKIEANESQVDVIKAVSDAGIPVMAHIGIRPQSVAMAGKLKAQGTTAEMALQLCQLADKMTQAGAMSLLLEGVAREAAEIVTESTQLPVISCGSGPDCDGQILIISDILGLNKGKGPKFSKKFGQIGTNMVETVKSYSKHVRSGQFPDDTRCYHMKSGEVEKLKKILEKRG
jgi:3-methyl-2-oxobutanoate hydroxymethyltransferase